MVSGWRASVEQCCNYFWYFYDTCPPVFSCMTTMVVLVCLSLFSYPLCAMPRPESLSLSLALSLSLSLFRSLSLALSLPFSLPHARTRTLFLPPPPGCKRLVACSVPRRINPPADLFPLPTSTTSCTAAVAAAVEISRPLATSMRCCGQPEVGPPG